MRRKRRTITSYLKLWASPFYKGALMTMQIEPTDMKRFRLEGKLGEGADSEAFAATDALTGRAVVVKRPHLALIARGHHAAVERRMARVIALRERHGDALPHVARMIAHTAPANHAAYFGDAQGAAYTVMVEERAKGLPLVGSAIDGIKRKPIGVPQNLFAVHPVFPHRRRGRFAIARGILEVAEAFHNAGALLLDMRPQNIYFDPSDARIAVIDIGGITQARAADSRDAPLDLHDFYLELVEWYLPPSDPPTAAAEYAAPYEMVSTPMFKQSIDALIRRRMQAVPDESQAAALDILRRISARAYPDIDAFRIDLEAYLSILDRRYARLSQCQPVAQAWLSAKRMLTDAYWRKFRFYPQSLAAYDSAP